MPSAKKGQTYMKEILIPYASFATVGLSERKRKNRFLMPYGSGATRMQKVAISAARSRNVSE